MSSRKSRSNLNSGSTQKQSTRKRRRGTNKSNKQTGLFEPLLPSEKFGLIRSQAQLDKFFDPRTYRKKSKQKSEAPPPPPTTQNISVLSMSSLDEEDDDVHPVETQQKRVRFDRTKSSSVAEKKKNNDDDDELSFQPSDEESESFDFEQESDGVAAKQPKKVEATTIVPNRSGRNADDVRIEDFESGGAFGGDADDDGDDEESFLADKMTRAPSKTAKGARPQKKQSRSQRRAAVASINREYERAMQHEQERRDQLTLLSERRSRVVNDENYVRIEGTLVKIYSVVDLYASNVEEDRHRCMDQIKELGLEQIQQEQNASANAFNDSDEGSVDGEGRKNKKKPVTKRKKIKNKKEEAKQRKIERRQQNLLFHRDTYNESMQVLTASLSAESLDAQTNGANNKKRRVQIRGADKQQSARQRIEELMETNVHTVPTSSGAADMHLSSNTLQTLRRRSRYKVHFEVAQSYYSDDEDDDDEDGEQDEAQQQKEEERQHVSLLVGGQTLQEAVAERDEEMRDAEGKIYDAQEEKTQQRSSLKTSARVRQDLITLVGYFDDIPKFGEYFVFMCDRSDRNTHGKRLNVVRWKVYQQSMLCPLDLTLLKRIYLQEFGDRVISSTVNVVLSPLYDQLAAKFGVSMNARTKDSVSGIQFELIDPSIDIDKHAWFYRLFLQCEYLQRKFLSEIEPYYSSGTIKMFHSLDANTLYVFLQLVKYSPFALCFHWQYPSAAQILFSSSDEQRDCDLELDVDRYVALHRHLHANNDAEVPALNIRIINYYRTYLKNVHEQSRSNIYMLEEQLGEMDDEFRQALIDTKVLICVDEQTPDGDALEKHYYTQGDYKSEFAIFSTFARLQKDGSRQRHAGNPLFGVQSRRRLLRRVNVHLDAHGKRVERNGDDDDDDTLGSQEDGAASDGAFGGIDQTAESMTFARIPAQRRPAFKRPKHVPPVLRSIAAANDKDKQAGTAAGSGDDDDDDDDDAMPLATAHSIEQHTNRSSSSYHAEQQQEAAKLYSLPIRTQGASTMQADAIESALTRAVTVVNAPAGSGKTWLAGTLETLVNERDRNGYHLPGRRGLVSEQALLVAYSATAASQFQRAVQSTNVHGYTIGSVLSALNRTQKATTEVSQAIDEFRVRVRDLNGRLPRLNETERKLLRNTPVRSFFVNKHRSIAMVEASRAKRQAKRDSKKRKHKQTLTVPLESLEFEQRADEDVAILLHIVFNQYVDTRKLRDFCVHCSLQQRTLLIVDEASLIDTNTMANLFVSLPSIRHLVVLGDSNQVPPLSRGHFFEQLLLACRALDKADESSPIRFYDWSADDNALLPRYGGGGASTQQWNHEIQPNLAALLRGDLSSLSYATNIERDMDTSQFLVAQRPSASSRGGTAKLVRQLLDRYARTGVRTTRGTQLNDLQLVVLSNHQREQYNRICYEWQLAHNIARIRHNDAQDEFMAKEKHVIDRMPFERAEWSCDGAFKSYADFVRIERLKHDAHKSGGYEPHEFYRGERVVFMRNHSGIQKMRFCPFPSDPVRNGLVDTIEFIVDYDDRDNRCTFRSYTGEMRVSNSTRRFLVLRQSKKLVLLDAYDPHWIERCYATTYRRCQGSESSTTVALVNERASEVLSVRELYVALSRARQRVVLVCNMQQKGAQDDDEGAQDEQSQETPNDLERICTNQAGPLHSKKNTADKQQCILFKRIK